MDSACAKGNARMKTVVASMKKNISLYKLVSNTCMSGTVWILLSAVLFPSTFSKSETPKGLKHSSLMFMPKKQSSASRKQKSA